jgi:beta-exotoxin I transport system ATP-binding protein
MFPGMEAMQPVSVVAPAVHDVEAAAAPTGAGEVVVTDGLTTWYGRTPGVTDLTITLWRGEAFGFLGPNGAGKTTTIRTLLDFIRPTRGTARIFGLDSRRDSVAIKRRIGYLPAELALYDDMTGADMLRYFANLRGGVDWRTVQRLAERLQCDLHQRIRSLSHGNKRKVGIVQAFMHRPELLVLDEPTSGLDPLIQQEFHQLVDEARAAGASVLLSSHVLPEVERICDRVGILSRSRLVTVEHIATLKERSLRRVDVSFAAPVTRTEFAALQGVRDVAVDGATLHCAVTGAVDALVKACARHTVLDMVVREPTLEEIFLAYYGENGSAA